MSKMKRSLPYLKFSFKGSLCTCIHSDTSQLWFFCINSSRSPFFGSARKADLLSQQKIASYRHVDKINQTFPVLTIPIQSSRAAKSRCSRAGNEDIVQICYKPMYVTGSERTNFSSLESILYFSRQLKIFKTFTFTNSFIMHYMKDKIQKSIIRAL